MGPIRKTKDAAQKGKQAKDQAAEEAAITADNAERQERARQGLGQVVDEAQDPVSRDQRLQDTKENVKQRIPEERKQQLREQREKTKVGLSHHSGFNPSSSHMLSQEYAQNKFPEERRDRFIYRLKKIVVECQEREEYNEAYVGISYHFRQWSVF